MKRLLQWITVVSIFMIPLNSLLAATSVDKATLEQLIKGNTIEGSLVKWKTTYKTYFDPSGKFSRVDSLNNVERGTWVVSDDGRLLMTGFKKGKEKDREVKKRDDGVYEVYSDRGEVIWTIEKVSPGNPYDLKLK